MQIQVIAQRANCYSWFITLIERARLIRDRSVVADFALGALVAAAKPLRIELRPEIAVLGAGVRSPDSCLGDKLYENFR